MTTRQIKIIPPIQTTVTGGGGGSSKPLIAATTPATLNFATDPTPGTETSISLAQIVRFQMTNRGDTSVRFSYQSGTGVTWSTLYPQATYSEENLNSVNITLYIQSASASQRLEVIAWS